MKLLGAFLMVATIVWPLTLAQNVFDCSTISRDLETTPITPVTIPDLPVCVDQRSVAQCCSRQYINAQINYTGQLFVEGLRLELQERFDDFQGIVANLRSFIVDDFLPSYLESIGNLRFLGTKHGLSHIRRFISDLENHIDFIPGDDTITNTNNKAFNVSSYVANVLSGIENATVVAITGHNRHNNISQCIRQAFKNNTQSQHVQAHVSGIQQIRRVTAYIDGLRSFVQNFTQNVAGFRPLQQCVNTVVRLNTCGRCTAVRPPLCENVCEAIASACYSPFNATLVGQLNQLWGTMRALINTTNGTIASMNINMDLLNKTTFVSQVLTNCKINPNQQRDLRQQGVNIPSLPRAITRAAARLRGGPFNYSRRQREGSGLCRLIDTTDTNCWNGSAVLRNDIPEFNGTTIRDQVNNPVISIPQQQLTRQASSLGTPITNALTSSNFSQIAPVGLVIPGVNGAAKLYLPLASLVILILAVIIVL